MQDALGFGGVGSEAGKEKSKVVVAVYHLALPAQGTPTAQFPAQATDAVVGVVVHTAVNDVVLEELTVYSWQFTVDRYLYSEALFGNGV